MAIKVDKRQLQRLIKNLGKEADAALAAVAQEMTNDIQLSFGTSPPGRSHKRGSITHTASQPDYPPNVDTGQLRASMRWKKISVLRYLITDGVEYGIFLEVGTARIAKRPFVRPVFESWAGGRLAEFLRSRLNKTVFNG